MRAVTATAEGPALLEVSRPAPGPEEVLVRVHAAALNRADLAMLKGASHGAMGGAGLPLGLEWAGEIVELGADVRNWKVGDRVMAAGPAAFAEYALGHCQRIYPIPTGISFPQAATLPVALQTTHDAIATNGQLRPGQSVLIQGATSSVGLIGLQVAKLLGAGTVIGTSTSDVKRARLSEFGADHAIDCRASDWVAQVTAASGGKGVDLVIDHLAGPYMNGNMQAARIGGRIVNVGRMAGESGEVDFNLHSLRRISYVGVTFRTRGAAEVQQIVARTIDALFPALSEGRLTLPIDQTFGLDAHVAAFERMAANRHFGKLVFAIERD